MKLSKIITMNQSDAEFSFDEQREFVVIRKSDRVVCEVPLEHMKEFILSIETHSVRTE